MGTLVAVLLTGQAAMKLPSRLDSSAVVGETPSTARTCAADAGERTGDVGSPSWSRESHQP